MVPSNTDVAYESRPETDMSFEDSTSDDDLAEEVLAELGYKGKFECWADVFWWLCGPLLGDRRQDLKALISLV